MSKTVREQFDFLGSKSSLAGSNRPIFDKNPPKDGDELALRVTDMWGSPYREIQYAACDYLFRHKHLLGGQHLNFWKHLIKTRSWKKTPWTSFRQASSAIRLALPGSPGENRSLDPRPEHLDSLQRDSFQIQYRDRTDWEMLRDFCAHCAQDELLHQEQHRPRPRGICASTRWKSASSCSTRLSPHHRAGSAQEHLISSILREKEPGGFFISPGPREAPPP